MDNLIKLTKGTVSNSLDGIVTNNKVYRKKKKAIANNLFTLVDPNYNKASDVYGYLLKTGALKGRNAMKAE